MDKLEVGQKLWFAPKSRGGGVARWITIEKVGREYAYSTTRHRISVRSLEVTERGFGEVGQCYLKQEDHEAYVALCAAWSDFRQEIYRSSSAPPSGVTIQVLSEIKQRLFGDPK